MKDNLFRKTIICVVIAAAVYLLLFFFFDRPIALWVHSYADTWFFQSGTYTSILATGAYFRLALAFCFILVLICDSSLKKRWTRNLLYICVSLAIAITIGDGLKYLLGRHRPVGLFTDNKYGLHFFSTKWALNSSPSGHTIRAFSLLTSLSLLFRRWAPVFIPLAVLIGVSRVAVTAHYPSDVLFGAFIGTFTALWTYRYFYDRKTTE